MQSEIPNINEFQWLTSMVQHLTCNFSVCNSFKEIILLFSLHIVNYYFVILKKW